MNQTPILLITGYLGSGKTTLVNNILANKQGIRFAVIVNDIGEVNIDASLIQKGGIVNQDDESLVALQNGCICCSLKMDLVKQINDIISQERFDYIVIEASGICEPAPIAQTICSIPMLNMQELAGKGIAPDASTPMPRLDAIVTVVDVLRMVDEFDTAKSLQMPELDEEDIERLVIEQIEFCNIILLNKVSEVTKEQLGLVRQIIRTLQPKAQIIECDYTDIDLNRILYTEKFNFEEVATSAAWVQKIEEEAHEEHHHHHEDGHEHHEEHHHEHHHHGEDDHLDHSHCDHEHGHCCHHHHDHDHNHGDEYGIGTFVYYRRRPFDLRSFEDFVIGKMHGIIRTKGVCWFKDDNDMSFLFEQAGSQKQLKEAGQWFATMEGEELEIMMEREPQLRKDWDEKVGDRMQKIVFIGQHLDAERIVADLDTCLVTI
ncbi:MAG: GTP-binding protein [Bacteroidaceae bacterium]|nr:GTP-binding protein [Bacteroidaceae bacterium]